VRDGETVWSYNAVLREYLEEPGDIAGVKRGSSYGVGIFARANAYLVTRFAHLANFSATARLAGRHALRDGFFQGETILVELKPPRDVPAQWIERIWIDPRTNLIVKSVFTNPGSDSNTFHYTFRLVNEPIPDEFFAFRPPKNARRVKKFSAIPRELG
jgi:outer membrane lipoprotein-sorting protein